MLTTEDYDSNVWPRELCWINAKTCGCAGRHAEIRARLLLLHDPLPLVAGQDPTDPLTHATACQRPRADGGGKWSDQAYLQVCGGDEAREQEQQ